MKAERRGQSVYFMREKTKTCARQFVRLFIKTGNLLPHGVQIRFQSNNEMLDLFRPAFSQRRKHRNCDPHAQKSQFANCDVPHMTLCSKMLE